MSEKERLEEVMVLRLEHRKKADELAAIDSRIDALLFPNSVEKRKKSTRSVKDWNNILENKINERGATIGRALAR